ncbi:molybdopterin/thiamine biosynthesis adenylyltransferase [Nocardioides aromaticivorans]|uniref:Molybdopterin/thiamine biosynthesis adenylyltransferase n=1 Tax=Nocardioides aromaticivorans TaxID=200618 RepID=A0A7Y9ZGZ0_9ACTN|nr:ThiF family adenylyltransferase [Nocardioides aromaticivorans]NYI43795.1 molybdopterin/thiamine biosynthesis adenylyltransferase [Nocardioides aromaticivorans]
MSSRIAFTEDQFTPLVAALGARDETAAVVATSFVEAPATTVTTADAEGTKVDQRVTLVAQTITPVPEVAYAVRGPMGLSISSTGWVPAFRAAAACNQVPVFVHTHPQGMPKFSTYDDQVDIDLAISARAFGAKYYAAVVLAGTPDAPEVAARLFDLGEEFNARAPEFVVIDAVRVAGAGLHLYLPPSADGEESTKERLSVFDRQIRMLGPDGNRTLKHVRAAIIGGGGTGSAVAVQVARLGLGELVVVDDDVVTDPTPTRGHGITTEDVDRLKVDALGDHLDAIGLGTPVIRIDKPLNHPDAIAAIAHADVVFSCVDGHGARLILNRWAFAHIAPVIDVAVLVAPTEGEDGTRRVQIEQRVTWVAPGTACLLCRRRVDPALAAAENLDPETRKRLAGEGYVQAAETPQPAVVTLTTSVAALAATEFLLRLTGLGKTDATELLLRSHLGELRRNARSPRLGCFCTNPDFIGRGTRAPYLDLAGVLQ